MTGGKHDNMKAWAPEEDQIIMEEIYNGGHQWSKIVQRLPGRTVSSVRNRWQRMEKGRTGLISKNRCHQCGQLKRGHTCIAKLKGGLHIPLSPGRAALPTQLSSVAFQNLVAPLRERMRAPAEPNVFLDGAATRAASPTSLSVDVGLATPPAKSANPPLPFIQRFNSSAFSALAAAEMLSPSSRDLYAKLFDSSPREPLSVRHTERFRFDRPLPESAQPSQAEPLPPSLRDSMPRLTKLPSLTRDIASFLNEANAQLGSPRVEAAPLPPPLGKLLSAGLSAGAHDSAGGVSLFAMRGLEPSYAQAPALEPSYSTESSLESSSLGLFGQPEAEDELAALAPPVVRRKSSRLTFNDLADIFDTESTPPMVPMAC